MRSQETILSLEEKYRQQKEAVSVQFSRNYSRLGQPRVGERRLSPLSTHSMRKI
jgi:hypothetical protein